MEKISFRFYLSSRSKNAQSAPDKKALWPIRMLVSFHGYRFELYTGQKCDLANWDKATSRVRKGAKVNGATASFINTELDRLKLKVTDIFEKKTVLKESVSPAIIREELKEKKVTNKKAVRTNTSVIELFDSYIQLITPDKSSGFIKQIKSTRNHLSAFFSKYKKYHIEEMNYLFFEKFKSYFLSELENSPNSFAGQVKRIKLFLNFANKAGWCKQTSYKDFRFTEKYDEPVFLTVGELQHLESFQFESDSLATTRDIFLFQSLTGCRFDDLYNLTIQNLVDVEDMGTFLIFREQKTNKPIEVPLDIKLLEILKRYKESHPTRLLPVPVNQVYNRNLKNMAIKANLNRVIHKIDKNGHPVNLPLYDVISSHMARKNFIGQMLLEYEIPEPTVKKMTGHSVNSRSFSRYFSVNREHLRSAINRRNREEK